MQYINLFSVRKQLLALLFLLFSLSIHSQQLFNNLENDSAIGNWIGLETKTSGDAYSGTFYSRTDSIIPYGLGIEQGFPEEVKGRNIFLKILGRGRTPKDWKNEQEFIKKYGNEFRILE